MRIIKLWKVNVATRYSYITYGYNNVKTHRSSCITTYSMKTKSFWEKKINSRN